MDLMTALIVGGLVGAIANAVTRSPGGFLWNVLIGGAGAFVGRMQFGALAQGAPLPAGSLSPWALLVAVLGAVVLIAAYNLASRDLAR